MNDKNTSLIIVYILYSPLGKMNKKITSKKFEKTSCTKTTLTFGDYVLSRLKMETVSGHPCPHKLGKTYTGLSQRRWVTD